jgi:hypothetical protein
MPKMCEKVEEAPSRTKERAPKMRDLTMEWKNPLQEPKNLRVQKTKDLAMEWKNQPTSQTK